MRVVLNSVNQAWFSSHGYMDCFLLQKSGSVVSQTTEGNNNQDQNPQGIFPDMVNEGVERLPNLNNQLHQPFEASEANALVVPLDGNHDSFDFGDALLLIFDEGLPVNNNAGAILIDAAAIEVPVVLQIPQEHVTDPQEVAPKPEVPAIGVPAAVPKIFQVLQEAFGIDPAAAAVPERDEEVLIYGPPPANHVNVQEAFAMGDPPAHDPEFIQENVEVTDPADAPEMVPEIPQVDLGALRWVRRRRTRVRYLEPRKYIYRPLSPPPPPPPPPPGDC